MSKETNALKLALEALEDTLSGDLTPYQAAKTITAIREALADSALDRMAENARELGLDYEPPCKTGSQCTSKCQQCEQPAQQPHCNDCGGFDPECPLAQPTQKETK